MHKLVKRQPAACLDDGLADVGSERVLVGVVVVCGHGVIVAGLGWERGGKNTGADAKGAEVAKGNTKIVLVKA